MDCVDNGGFTNTYPLPHPPGFVSTYDAPMVVPSDSSHHSQMHLAFYAGYLTTFLADFLIRPFVDKHIKGYVLARIPIPKFDEANPIMRRTSELSLSAAIDGWSPKGFGCSPSGHSRHSAERVVIDASWRLISGISADQITSLFDSFESIKTDELLRLSGLDVYRTHRLVLEAWDRLASGSCT